MARHLLRGLYSYGLYSYGLAYILMAYILMAYILMVYAFMAYILMVYAFMAYILTVVLCEARGCPNEVECPRCLRARRSHWICVAPAHGRTLSALG